MMYLGPSSFIFGLTVTCAYSSFILVQSQPQISFHQLYKQGQGRPIEAFSEPIELITPKVHPQIISPVIPPPPVAPVHSKGTVPILSCPSGFELVGKSCQSVHYIQGTPMCGKKTDLFENGLCITLEEVKPSSKCPKDSQSDGKKCYYVEATAPDVACPKLYELAADGSGCIKKTHQKSKQECPPGYQPKGGKCIRETKTPAAQVCPAGFVKNEKDKKDECIKVETAVSEAKCKEKGSKISGEHCIKTEYMAPQTKCPVGYKDQGDGWCTTTEISLADSVCPEGTISSHKGCVEISVDTPVPSCKKDFVFQNNICRKVEQKSIVPKCSEGYKLKDGMCTQTQVMEAERVCSPGAMVEDKGCWQISSVPPSFHCEKGELDEQGMCVKVDHTDPKLVCSQGTLSGGICKILRKQEADIICPPGSQLEGKKCISYLMEDPSVYCKKSGSPPGPDGCTTIEKGAMKFSCPSGWKLNTEQCSREFEADQLYLCPHGMSLSGKKCEGHRIAQPDLVCPKEYTLGEGGICYTTEIEDPVQTCPPGYLLSGNMCVPTSPHKGARRLGSTKH